MAVQHLSSIDLRGRALLLGPGGDLELYASEDGADGSPRGVPVALQVTDGDTGPGRLGPTVVLVHVSPTAARRAAVTEAVGRGVAVVVAGPLDEALAAASALVAAGADPARVAVEVTVGPESAGPAVEGFAAAVGSGADGPGLAVSLDPPAGTDEERVAWEIGALTRVLSGPHPARTVRGADPVRFRRVRAVVAAVDGGVAP